jgi:hypothetical protein
MRAAALALLGAGFALTFLVAPWNAESVTDIPLYSVYAHAFLHGALPYRDVAFEYPPLAVPVIALPGLPGDGSEYRAWFAVLAIASAAAMVLLCGVLARATGGGRTRALLGAAAAPLLCGAMIRTHFDLVPVVLTLAALALVVGDRPRAGLSVLGVAVAVKLYPLVMAPAVLAWLVGRGQREAARDGALALALVVVVAYGAASGLSAAGTADSLTYHVDRAVQVESTPAIVLRGLDDLGLGHVRPDTGHKSDGLDHPASGVVTALFGLAMVAVIAWLAVAARRAAEGQSARRDLVLAALASTVAFACLGKVLSPQYLVWVAPLTALALAWRMHGLAAVCAAATALTLVEFPDHYREVVHRVPWVLGLVTVRDVLLLAAVGLALRELGVRSPRARAPAPTRSRWRGRRLRPRPAPR